MLKNENTQNTPKTSAMKIPLYIDLKRISNAGRKRSVANQGLLTKCKTGF